MPKLSAIAKDLPVKLLLVGDPGTGKTGSLVSLVKGGQRLFIQNYDGDTHVAPLLMYLTPEEQERVVVATLKDDLGLKGNQVWPKKPPTAFSRGMRLLDRWKEGEEDFGSVYDWGTDTTLVIDTLTSMGKAAMWWRLFVNQRWGKKPLRRQKDWGESMDFQEDFLDLLRSDSINCNVVVISHLTLLSGDSGEDDEDDEAVQGKVQSAPAPSGGNRMTLDFKRYPSALGRKLPPKVPGMFSAVVEAKVVGAGKNARRALRTVPAPDVDVKVPSLGLPPEIGIEDGLFRIFEAVRNGKAN